VTEQRIYREMFSSEPNARYIDLVVVDGVWLDAIHQPLPEWKQQAVRDLIAKENAERLLKAKPGSERIQ
jgi:hypothetical protein